MYDLDADEWSLMRSELAGNRMRVRRPPSTLTPAFEALYAASPLAATRPVSQFAVGAASAGREPARYRPDNIAALDLEWVAGTTQSIGDAGGWAGPAWPPSHPNSAGGQ